MAGEFRGWVADVERWNALTREALSALYEGNEPANEFYEAATGGAPLGYRSKTLRVVGTRDDEADPPPVLVVEDV
jgi:hypothetical protein